MKAKIFIGLLAFCVFTASMGAGYYWPVQAEQEEAPKIIEKKEKPPETSRRIKEAPSGSFARGFNKVRRAKVDGVLPALVFTGKGGKQRRFSEFKGHYTLVNLWATWCGPCVVELPSLEKLKKHYAGKGLDVVAISLDYGHNIDDLEEFLKTRDIADFALNHDAQQEIQGYFSPSGIPTSYLLGPDGQLLYTLEGEAMWSSPSAFIFFDGFLSENEG